MEKCEHIIGLMAQPQRIVVNDKLEFLYTIILGNSTNPDDIPDADNDEIFSYCPYCGERIDGKK